MVLILRKEVWLSSGLSNHYPARELSTGVADLGAFCREQLLGLGCQEGALEHPRIHGFQINPKPEAAVTTPVTGF